MLWGSTIQSQATTQRRPFWQTQKNRVNLWIFYMLKKIIFAAIFQILRMIGHLVMLLANNQRFPLLYCWFPPPSWTKLRRETYNSAHYLVRSLQVLPMYKLSVKIFRLNLSPFPIWYLTPDTYTAKLEAIDRCQWERNNNCAIAAWSIFASSGDELKESPELFYDDFNS